jgi:hypothetical protein
MTETSTLSDVIQKDHDHDDSGRTTPITQLLVKCPDISVTRALIEACGEPQETDLAAIKRKSRLVQSEHLRHLYSVSENLTTLENGGCLFSFVCHHELTEYEAAMVDAIINLSAFDNEEKENYVPHFEYAEYERQQQQQQQLLMEESKHSQKKPKQSIDDPLLSNDQSLQPKYTFLLARCGYLLTGFNLEDLLANPQIVTSLDYQKACQPNGTKIWEDYEQMDADTFRITKPIIPFIYSFTVQFRVSRVHNPQALHQLAQVLQIPIDGAIVLERTKRSKPPKEDATRKIKSILVYTDLGGGVVLVTHLTIMLQVGLPEVVERIIGSIGQWGLRETAETAWRTRQYLQRKLPYACTSFLDAKACSEEEGEDVMTMKFKSTETTMASKESDDDDDDDDFFDAIDDIAAQDLTTGIANLAVH